MKENLLGFFIDFDYSADLEFIQQQTYMFCLFIGAAQDGKIKRLEGEEAGDGVIGGMYPHPRLQDAPSPE